MAADSAPQRITRFVLTYKHWRAAVLPTAKREAKPHIEISALTLARAEKIHRQRKTMKLKKSRE